MGDPAMSVRGRLTGSMRSIRSLPTGDLPWPAVGRVLVDTVAVGVAGSRTELVQKLVATLPLPKGTARLWGSGEPVDVLTAAFVNGTATHALELDDIYARGIFHPGTVIVPAALTVGEHLGSNGVDVARALVAGYEVGCRLAEALGPDHYAYWHTTGTVGAVGAAAAAAMLLSDSDEVWGNALGLAATMAGGLQQTFRSNASGKPIHAGHAAHSGVLAAMLALSGVSSPDDIFEGQAGMAAAMRAHPDWTPIGRDSVPLCIEDITVKPYPCCGHTFAAIDGALEVRRGGTRIDEIGSVTVRTYTTAINVAGIREPSTPAEARFSIPFLVALALAQGTIGQDSLTDSVVNDPVLRTLARKVELRVGSEFDAAFPAHRGAELTVTTPSGTQVSMIPDRSGSPENPVSSEKLEAKFRDLTSGILGEGSADLLEQLTQLRLLSSAGQLTVSSDR